MATTLAMVSDNTLAQVLVTDRAYIRLGYTTAIHSAEGSEAA